MTTDSSAVVIDTVEEADIPQDGAQTQSRSSALRKVAPAVSVLLASALLTLAGLMLWHHHQVTAQRVLEDRFVEAARNGVTALLSIDHNHAKEDVQRVLDMSTGSFREQFAQRAEDFVRTADSSRVVTRGSVSAAALDTRKSDDAVVLLAANSQVTNDNGAKQDPRSWRMSVTITKEGEQFKMSDVEFVP